MLRDSLSASSNYVYMFATPGNGLAFRSRASSKAGTKQTSGGAGVAPVWVKIERKSSTLTAYRSADGVNWTAVSSPKLRLGQTLLVGLAVASHSKTASVSASLTDVSLNGTAVGAPVLNTPPTVSMNSPGAGAAFTAPAAISLGATAADSDGSIAKVDFYSGNTLLGTDTTSPYAFSWNNVAAGSYTVKAVATDNAGTSTTSGSVSVTVNANTPPAVSLTSPSGGTSFMAPASTTVAAAASDANGSVVRVDFYAGATLIGSDTSSPYAVSWSNVAAGSYVLTAKATDNAGASTMSAGVSVTVNANQAPTVSLTSPSQGATLTAQANISLTASATDVDGTIQKVEFFNGSTLLGSATSAPFGFIWQNVPAGSYNLSAVARDNLGASTVSSWIDVTVSSTTLLSKAIFSPAVVTDVISYYVFEVFAAGSDPATSAPIATQNLGVPAALNGEITVDVRNTIAGLAPGSYVATVSSMSSGEGLLRSSSFAFTR